MDTAIITERYADGRIRTLRSTVAVTADVRAAAEKLDQELARRTALLESRLVAEGLVDQVQPGPNDKKPRGNVQLWHAVGRELDGIVRDFHIVGVRERRWLWDALNGLHATARIKRASRGRTRSHFEYCYRIAQFPLALATKMYWSEWVYFFDSLTVREETRADKWLRDELERVPTVGRSLFRHFVENLNKQLKKIDTTVLTNDELTRLYDSVWIHTENALALQPREGG